MTHRQKIAQSMQASVPRILLSVGILVGLHAPSLLALGRPAGSSVALGQRVSDAGSQGERHVEVDSGAAGVRETVLLLEPDLEDGEELRGWDRLVHRITQPVTRMIRMIEDWFWE